MFGFGKSKEKLKTSPYTIGTAVPERRAKELNRSLISDSIRTLSTLATAFIFGLSAPVIGDTLSRYSQTNFSNSAQISNADGNTVLETTFRP